MPKIYRPSLYEIGEGKKEWAGEVACPMYHTCLLAPSKGGKEIRREAFSLTTRLWLWIFIFPIIPSHSDTLRGSIASPARIVNIGFSSRNFLS